MTVKATALLLALTESAALLGRPGLAGAQSEAAPPAPSASTAPSALAPSATLAPLPPPEPVPPEPVGEADAGERAPANPFRRGAVRLTLVLGTGSTVRDEYLILGGGLGYYLLDGAELGVDYEAWIMGSPVMQRLSPELRYVLHFVPLIKPYVGVFYRHAFINDYDDIDSVGGRLGVYYVTPRGRVYIGGGAVYDHMLDCAASTFVECDTIYPEISIGASL